MMCVHSNSFQILMAYLSTSDLYLLNWCRNHGGIAGSFFNWRGRIWKNACLFFLIKYIAMHLKLFNMLYPSKYYTGSVVLPEKTVTPPQTNQPKSSLSKMEAAIMDDFKIRGHFGNIISFVFIKILLNMSALQIINITPQTLIKCDTWNCQKFS